MRKQLFDTIPAEGSLDGGAQYFRDNRICEESEAQCQKQEWFVIFDCFRWSIYWFSFYLKFEFQRPKELVWLNEKKKHVCSAAKHVLAPTTSKDTWKHITPMLISINWCLWLVSCLLGVIPQNLLNMFWNLFFKMYVVLFVFLCSVFLCSVFLSRSSQQW